MGSKESTCLTPQQILERHNVAFFYLASVCKNLKDVDYFFDITPVEILARV